jgi:hypothetical protein
MKKRAGPAFLLAAALCVVVAVIAGCAPVSSRYDTIAKPDQRGGWPNAAQAEKQCSQYVAALKNRGNMGAVGLGLIGSGIGLVASSAAGLATTVGGQIATGAVQESVTDQDYIDCMDRYGYTVQKKAL